MRKHITLLHCLLVFSEEGHAKPRTAGSHSGPDVVDGQNAKPAQFPYQISMQIVNKHFCGGSILNENYILTASHCTKEFNSTDQHLITVVAGTINVNESLETRHVAKIIQHEDYQHDNSDKNDICLLKLDRPLKFNSKIKPVTLAEAHTPIPTGSPVQLSGWGSLGGEDNKKPTIL
ncbi:coagulation factor IX-like [Phymastichus coffea]|uniref:coagulation factor IX-like n=1 Tax=Phymastichus coffea TaxID=108790 RepID=UPI00273C173D|nr:coagulation factor IX-like [Phymastichus coffea]